MVYGCRSAWGRIFVAWQCGLQIDKVYVNPKKRGYFQQNGLTILHNSYSINLCKHVM